MYNAKLANNLGNLVNRVVVLSLKLSENTGVLNSNSLLNSLPFQGKEATIETQKLFSEYNLK